VLAEVPDMRADEVKRLWAKEFSAQFATASVGREPGAVRRP